MLTGAVVRLDPPWLQPGIRFSFLHLATGSVFPGAPDEVKKPSSQPSYRAQNALSVTAEGHGLGHDVPDLSHLAGESLNASCLPQ